MKYNQNTAKKIRSAILTMSYNAQVAHIPSALSQCDYLGMLFMDKGITPDKYKFIFGKPYGSQAYYALFNECGWSKEDLNGFGSINPKWRYIIQSSHPLVEYIDESMGNCISVGCGLAIGGHNVFINISDAAFQEGTIWESILFAGAKKLNNIILAIDYNKMQALGPIDSILTLDPLKEKLEAFGWETIVTGGNDLDMLYKDLPSFNHYVKTKPLALIFNTVKGFGCPLMENNESWHYRCLKEEEYKIALNLL